MMRPFFVGDLPPEDDDVQGGQGGGTAAGGHASEGSPHRPSGDVFGDAPAIDDMDEQDEDLHALMQPGH